MTAFAPKGKHSFGRVRGQRCQRLPAAYASNAATNAGGGSTMDSNMPAPVLKVIPWFLLFSGLPAGPAVEAVPATVTTPQPATVTTPPAPAHTPSINRFTRAERHERCALNAPPAGDQLVFPVPGMPVPYDAPFHRQAVEAATPIRFADNSAAFLFQLPASESLDRYLLKRQELKPEQWQTLIDWCLQENLPQCAEYELRRRLATYKHFYDPGYKAVKDRWLKQVANRRSDYRVPLPVHGEWYVVPDSSGHHRLKAGAAFAYDLVILKDGKMHRDSGGKLEDHYAWNQPVLAQAEALVVQADDHFEDLPLTQGASLAQFDQANYVILDYGGGLRALYAHLRKGSLKVKVGDTVQPGQTLAAVGNSGASGTPHLHFTLLDSGHLSLRGRFDYERLAGDAWIAFHGDDLKEGARIRNLADAFTRPMEDVGRAAPVQSSVTPATSLEPAAP